MKSFVSILSVQMVHCSLATFPDLKRTGILQCAEHVLLSQTNSLNEWTTSSQIRSNCRRQSTSRSMTVVCEHKRTAETMKVFIFTTVEHVNCFGASHLLITRSSLTHMSSLHQHVGTSECRQLDRRLLHVFHIRLNGAFQQQTRLSIRIHKTQLLREDSALQVCKQVTTIPLENHKYRPSSTYLR